VTLSTECLPAGTYYIFVAPQFTNVVSCPSDYALTVSCEPCYAPTGACCVDFVCVATNEEAECGAMGGQWTEGQTCPEFECPPCVYCTPCFTNFGEPRPTCDNAGSPDDWITNVTFNTINNETVNEPGPCSYGNYTSLSTEVAPGETYMLSVTFCSEGTWTEYVSVWIDWDQDCVLEESERYFLGSGVDATLTMDITVPEDAVDGPTLMRVIERYSAESIDPCEEYSYGEAEDYTVVVSGICGDLDYDGDVDVDDFFAFLDAFGTCDGDLKYNPDADFDGDSCITLVDYQMWMDCYRDANGKSFVPTMNRVNSRPAGQQAPRGARLP
jgi:hypothetical protein